MQTISVQLPAAPPATYDVRIAPGLLDQLGDIARTVAPAPSCGIVSDANVAPHYLARATKALESAGFRVLSHIIPAGEQHKTLATASAVLDTFLNARVERATPIIALGGGVVGDLTGFVAASLLRGLPFIQVPTTLLAAVDASVGGKVGVDHATGKNLIGAFHQPRAVLTDIATFKTLPPREIRCGLAECIKHGIIQDASLFTFIEQNVQKILACDPAAMTELVARNVAIKARIVEQDPHEHGIRALLNLGHTFGHAIENTVGYEHIAHGEAVALGTVAAGRLAAAQNSLPREDLEKIIALLSAVGLPTSQKNLDIEKTFSTMFTDKNVRGGKLRLILPTKIGHAEIVTRVDESRIRAALQSLTT